MAQNKISVAMIKKTIYVFTSLLLLGACTEKSPSFRLSGHIDGVEKDEMIYLYNNNERADVDSVVNKEGDFEFTGSVNGPTYHYVVIRRDKDNVIYKGFWMENKDISFDGDINNLKQARVEGSEIQFEEEQYNEQVKTYDDAIEDLYGQMKTDDSVIVNGLNNQIDSLSVLKNKETTKFIKLNPDYFYSSYLAKRLVREISHEEGQKVYEMLSEENRNSEYGKLVKDYLDLNKNLSIGDQIADINLPDIKGKQISLSSFKGKYVLLDFWASWCGPCRRESPYLSKAYGLFKEKGFEIYSISIDKDELKWKKAVAEDYMSWTTVKADGAFDSKPAMMYGVKYIPYNFLIDPEGNIIEMQLRGDALIEKLEELL